MKTIDFSYGKKTLHLYFNGQAMLDINAMSADEDSDIIDNMNFRTPDGLKTLFQTAHILATQGELCRRYLHYTPERIPPVEELMTLSPMQVIGLQAAVVQAINDGYDQGKEEDGDIDTGLAELEKKTQL